MSILISVTPLYGFECELLESREEHSIIVIEHDMEFVRLLNSRVTVLNEGRIIAQGSLDEIKQHPEVSEAYLGR